MAGQVTDNQAAKTHNTNIQATNNLDTSPMQQDSLFMKLPAELRIVIYEIVAQDTVHDIIDREMANCNPFSGRLSLAPSPQVGALSLLLTSRTLRDESLPAMKALVQVEVDKAIAKLERTDAEAYATLGVSNADLWALYEKMRRLRRACEELRRLEAMLSH